MFVENCIHWFDFENINKIPALRKNKKTLEPWNPGTLDPLNPYSKCPPELFIVEDGKNE